MVKGTWIRGVLKLLLVVMSLPAIGAGSAQTVWPNGQWETATPEQVGMDSYQPKEISSVMRLEFGAGISANVDAMARIGYYLNRGQWWDRQVIPATFVGVVKDKGKWPGAPYPPSQTIQGIEWAPADTILRKAEGGDNWPITWADDGNLYTAYGDGQGFEPKVDKKLSLGFAKIIDGPQDFKGVNIRSRTGELVGEGSAGPKASGMLCVDGILYMLGRNVGNSQVAWSDDHAVNWQ